MTTMKIAHFVLATAFAVALGASSLAAQRQMGMGEPRYDPSTEVTITGTVSEVQTHQGRMNRTGIHLVVATPNETKEVHVAPTDWLAVQHVSFTKGEALRITGSAVTLDGTPVILARQIVRGDITTTLRNAQGVPEWGRARGRRQG